MEDGMTASRCPPIWLLFHSSLAHANKPKVLLVSKCYHFFKERIAVSTLEDKVEQQKGDVEGSNLQDIPWSQYITCSQTRDVLF